MPTTLEEMHLADASYDDLLAIGKQATMPDETMSEMPFEVTPEMVAQALIAVDSYVKQMD